MSQNYVFVIDSTQRPLHPIPPAKARKLLTKNQAAVFRLYPFTIVLKHAVNNFDNIGYELKIAGLLLISVLAVFFREIA